MARDLDSELSRLLDFGRAFPHPDGGAAWLDEHGQPDLGHGVETWITGRMTHIYALAQLLGVDGAGDLADAGLAGLNRLHDDEFGGWVSQIAADGTIPDEKSCYAHAFVVLAASSATIAGRSGAEELLTRALACWDEYFYEEATGLVIDTWDRSFTEADGYRGLNATMHSVEALLAAGDATGDQRWHDRALVMCRWVAALAAAHDDRLPEHFDSDWTPLLDLNHDRPGDPFKPYGATVGHGLEWSRLLLHTGAAHGPQVLAELAGPARALFDRAVADGWNVDGKDGFVYTTDWDGTPVVRDRMHWVAAEAVAAAGALLQLGPDPALTAAADLWWAWIEDHLIDRENGSWHHQLDADNQPVATVWAGKPDLYHAVQCILLPRLPLAPGLAAALRG